MLNTDEKSFFLDQVEKIEKEKSESPKEKRKTRNTFTGNNSKKFMSSFVAQKKRTITDNKTRSIKRQGSLLGGLKNNKKEFKFSSNFDKGE